jgi:hypothetical protein
MAWDVCFMLYGAWFGVWGCRFIERERRRGADQRGKGRGSVIERRDGRGERRGRMCVEESG